LKWIADGSAARVADERWSFPAVPQSVHAAREVARTLALRHRAEPPVHEAMALCVSEAVSNSVVHAYRDRSEPGTVELTATLLAGAICLYVRDHGLGLTPRIDSPGAGFGLALIAHYTDQFEVRTTPAEGTEIVMRFPLPGAL
jgi:anti-sigma regulatory factor (Ser/Thr protein kinase)